MSIVLLNYKQLEYPINDLYYQNVMLIDSTVRDYRLFYNANLSSKIQDHLKDGLPSAQQTLPPLVYQLTCLVDLKHQSKQKKACLEKTV